MAVDGDFNFADKLGNAVVDHEGVKVSIDTFTGDGKYVGLYFSAHWCPPCRGFTPKLAEFYESVKGKGLEIIFISSDRDEKGFTDYFGSMPWLALDFSEREKKTTLCEDFGVRGIPNFVLLDGKTGKTLIANGRGRVDSDPEGKEFPWLSQDQGAVSQKS